MLMRPFCLCVSTAMFVRCRLMDIMQKNFSIFLVVISPLFVAFVEHPGEFISLDFSGDKCK